MMASDTLLLMQLYWRLDRRADGGIGRLGWLRRALVGGVVVSLSSAGGIAIATVVKQGLVGPVDAAIVPSLLLTLVLLGTVFSGFSQALQALFLSDDLERLLVAPIPSHAVVTAKLLGRLPTTLFFLLAAAVPALIAFGVVLEFGPLFYGVGLILLLAAPLFGIALGTLIAIFLVRLLPARRLSEWLGAASIVIGTLFSFFAFLPRLLQRQRDELSPQAEAALADLVNGINELPLPTGAAGRALIDLGQGQVGVAAVAALLTYLLVTAGFFLMTIFVADRLYLSGWLRMQSSGARAQVFEDEAGIFGGDSLDLVLGYKDWLLRVRDAKLLATLFSSLVVAIFMALLIFRPQSGEPSLFNLGKELGSSPLLAAIFSPGVIFAGMTLFIAWSSFSRVAGSALSLERGAVYILKCAPIAPSRILRAKVLGVLAPYMLLVSVLLVAGAFVLEYSWLWLPYAWLAHLIMGVGLIACAVSLDFLFPQLTWEDPRRMTNRKAGWRSLVGSILYSVPAAAIALLAFVVAVLYPSFALPTALLGLSLLAAGTWFFVSVRVRLVEKAWPTLGTDVASPGPASKKRLSR